MNLKERQIVAFSLYGNHPKYLVGAVENAKDMHKFYSGWKMHIWVSDEIPAEVRKALEKSEAVIHPAQPDLPNKMFWRFLAHDLPGVERYLVRDVDSRFSAREVEAVNVWILQGTQLHVMRDHNYHSMPIMGCSFGWKKDPQRDFDMAAIAKQAAQDTAYGKDQEFLARTLWRFAKDKTVHDSCGTFDGTTNWKSSGPGFVGEYVSADGKFNEGHRQMRLEHLKMKGLL